MQLSIERASLLSPADSANRWVRALRRPRSVGPWLTVGAAPLGLAAALAPGWAIGSRSWPDGGAPSLLLVLAALVAWRALSQEPAGPLIHDRQLDLIITALATVGAVELIHLSGNAGQAGALAAGARCLMAVAVVTAGWGTRALWQVRWAVVLLGLTWQLPWALLAEAVWPATLAAALFLGQLPPWSDARVVGDVLVATGADGRPHVLDPSAGGSVLLLVVVGVAAGLAVAAGRGSHGRAIAWAVGGPLFGVAAAAATWTATATTGAAGAWSSGAVHAAALVAAAAVTLVLRRTAGHRRGAGAAAGARLRGAVPRAWPAAGLVALLVVAFLALQLAGTGPAAAAVPPVDSAADDLS